MGSSWFDKLSYEKLLYENYIKAMAETMHQINPALSVVEAETWGYNPLPAAEEAPDPDAPEEGDMP